MCVTFRCEISEIKQFKVHIITTIVNQTHYVRIIVYPCIQINKIEITNTQFLVMFIFLEVIALLLIITSSSCSDILFTTLS